MQKVTILSLTVLTLCFISGCSFLFDEPKTEVEKLPPESQSGEWNFGCLVNGKAVVVTNSMLMRAETRGEQLVISFEQTVDNRVWSDELTSFSFVMTDSLEVNVEYDLSELNLYSVQFIDYTEGVPNCTYEPEHTYSGQFMLSNFDRTNYIVSGTFNFESKNQNCDTIRVTDGRFDVHYFPY